MNYNSTDLAIEAAGKTDLVSVIIPCYNQGQYLGVSVESVLQQGGCRVQIIVVDDGSTDNTREVAEAIGPGILYLRQTNRGAEAARNEGILRAEGDFIVFLDADDWLLPGALGHHLTMMKSAHSIAVTCGGWCYSNPDGCVEPDEFPAPRFVPDAFHAFARSNLAPIHCFMARRQSVTEVGGMDTRLTSHEDWDLWMKIAGAGFGFASVPATVAVYRRSPFSRSTNGAKMARTAYQVLRRASKFHTNCAACGVALESGRDSIYRYWMRIAKTGLRSPLENFSIYRAALGADPHLHRRIFRSVRRNLVRRLHGQALEKSISHSASAAEAIDNRSHIESP